MIDSKLIPYSSDCTQTHLLCPVAEPRMSQTDGEAH